MRDAARAHFDALSRTLGLEALELASSATIRPGTIGPAARSPVEERQRVARTLPRLDVAAAPASGKSTELELTRLLGEGGMGAVWLARQRSLDREVAVKRLKETGPPSVQGTLALLAEGRATGALEHPSIVPVHALGLDEHGSPLLVMKRVDGASLETLITDAEHPAWPGLERRHGDRLTAKIEILMRVADALELAHARGYLHRDVKPENVMVGAFGEVYLLDWGVALRKDALTDEERAAVSIVGTPAFMAPEMVYGLADRVDARTDVFLLGATLHAALTGRPRHEGETLHEVLLAAIVADPPREAPETPPELAELVRRSTAAVPDERPQAASAFRDALAEILRHRSSLRLAAEADARLSALAEADAEPTSERLATAEATRTLLECRFALDQALRDHAGNEPARRARGRALRWLARGEIHRRSPDAAEAFLRELDRPDEALAAQAVALRASLAEGRRLEAEARSEAHERDPRVAAKQRFFIGAALLLVAGCLAIAFAGVRVDDVAAAAVNGISFAVNASVFAIVSVVTMLLRARIFATRRARAAMATLLMAGGFLVASDGYCFFLDAHDAAVSRPFTTLAIGGVLAGASLGVGRLAMVGGILLAIAGGVMVVWPELPVASQSIAFIATLAVFVMEDARLAFGARHDEKPPSAT
jgi:hypothetical protein